MKRGYDVRSVANIVLLRARELGLGVTNLHLNKSLFFIHVDYLRDFDKPLVSAKIEAWEYGPVFREVYNQFKRYKKEPIGGLAKRVSYATGELVDAHDPIPEDTVRYVRELADLYLNVPAGLLVELSHATGGAWDRVWSKGVEINAGMEITEAIIRECELPIGKRIKIQ
ncbi:Panacea domain-containing protein [Pseudotabrizicola sp. L79]|uniref:Panacea domain-containing protein n=1 Tax=Pseudotabrizicola sp. L79 TaxID=3118402 RepID=UPI002F94B1A7